MPGRMVDTFTYITPLHLYSHSAEKIKEWRKFKSSGQLEMLGSPNSNPGESYCKGLFVSLGQSGTNP